jgi:hypothetical protein
MICSLDYFVITVEPARRDEQRGMIGRRRQTVIGVHDTLPPEDRSTALAVLVKNILGALERLRREGRRMCIRIIRCAVDLRLQLDSRPPRQWLKLRA